MADNAKLFHKGDTIIKESDKVTPIYLIRNGHVSILAGRGRGKVPAREVMRLGPGHVIGERELFGTPRAAGIAVVAAEDCELLPLQIEWTQKQLEGAPQVAKIMLKSLVERQGALLNQVKDLVAEKDPRPCPEEAVPHTFGAIFVYAKLKGTQPQKDQPNCYQVDWNGLRQYSQRVLTVAPSRLEQCLRILKKLGKCEMIYEVVDDPKVTQMLEKNPNMDQSELPKELRKIILKDVLEIERFFEFYQNTYYKALNPEALRVDEKLTQFVREMLTIAADKPVDRTGIVRMDFKTLMDQVAAVLGPSSTDYFARLESKGLFCKRATTSSGTEVALLATEFQEALSNWAILREIEKWNEKGSVELDEEKKARAKPLECAGCSTPLQETHKFCPNCGAPQGAEANGKGAGKAA